MGTRKMISIVGLDRFGLTPGAFRRLGKRPVTVEVEIDNPPYIYPSRAIYRQLIRMSPGERSALARNWRRRRFVAMRREVSCEDAEEIKFNGNPVGLRMRMPAIEVERLRGMRTVATIRVRSIDGYRETPAPAGAPRLYAVKGHMTFQFEGQTNGTQLCEERITVLSARSEREARARVSRLMASEEDPFLSTSGHLQRWRFEGISDICECPDSTFDPRGTEVFYTYRNRRVRRESEWHPASDSAMQTDAAPRRR